MLEKLSVRYIYLIISLILLVICIINKGFITTDDILEKESELIDITFFELIKDFKEEVDQLHPIGFVNKEDATSYLIGNLYGITKGMMFEDNKTYIDRLNKFYNRYYQIGFGLHYVDFVTVKITSGAKRIEKKFLGLKYYIESEAYLPEGKYIEEGTKGVTVISFNFWSLIPINIHNYMLSPIFYVSLIFFFWSTVPFTNSVYFKK